MRARSPETWVLWVHASNAARFKQSCQDIVEDVKAPGRHSPNANLYQVLRNWLQDKAGQWVLILDNVDDDQFLFETPLGEGEAASYQRDRSSERPIWAYFPQSLYGSILITSRSRRAVSRMVKNEDIFNVEPMNSHLARLLFEKKLKTQADGEDIAQLTEALEHMPLAITTVAAYINHRSPLVSVRRYLEDFQGSDRKKVSLLGHTEDRGSLRRDDWSEHAIFKTWQITFHHLREKEPVAADLLSLMSFFDRQGIPTELLHAKSGLPVVLKEARSSESREKASARSWTRESDIPGSADRVEDAISILRDYSLISVSGTESSFTMHRLVQICTQEWLLSNGSFEPWKECFVRQLAMSFPQPFPQDVKKCESLFPHAQTAFKQKPTSKSSLEDWASLLYAAAFFAHNKRDQNDCYEMADAATSSFKSCRGLYDERSIQSTQLMASIIRCRGDFKKAEAMQLRVLKTLKRAPPCENITYTDALEVLALIYYNQGRFQEALRLQMKVVEKLKRDLGPKHASTLNSMSSLGSTLCTLGRFDEAENLQIDCLEAWEQRESPDSMVIMDGMANLAATYSAQGRLNEALILTKHVLDTRKRILGPNSPDTLSSMMNLAVMCENLGRFEEAEALETTVLRESTKALGPDHPETLFAMYNLSYTLRGLGKSEEATHLLEECSSLQLQKLGADHPDTRESIEKLSSWKTEDSMMSSSTPPESVSRAETQRSLQMPVLPAPPAARKRDMLSRFFVKARLGTRP